MSVSHVHLNVLVTYHSLGGNTKAVANYIESYIREQGHQVLVSDISKLINPEHYDLVFIGSFTWGSGELPNQVRNYLRWMLKENAFNLPKLSVFGTGDTQWTHFCRAVDEMEYHLSKHTEVISKLKIEQHPINQKDKLKNYVIETLEEF